MWVNIKRIIRDPHCANVVWPDLGRGPNGPRRLRTLPSIPGFAPAYLTVARPEAAIYLPCSQSSVSGILWTSVHPTPPDTAHGAASRTGAAQRVKFYSDPNGTALRHFAVIAQYEHDFNDPFGGARGDRRRVQVDSMLPVQSGCTV